MNFVVNCVIMVLNYVNSLFCIEDIMGGISMNDILKKMKAKAGDKLVELNCSTCEYNTGIVCAGHGTRTDNKESTYGMPIEKAEKMFSKGCDDFGISLNAFIEQEKLNGR